MKEVKIFLMLFVLLVGTAYTQPQPGGKMLMPDSAVVNLVIAREQGKECKVQLGIINQKILNAREELKEVRDSSSILSEGLKGQIAKLLEQKAVYDDQLKAYERLLRRERRKRFLTGAMGLATTAAAFYIGLK